MIGLSGCARSDGPVTDRCVAPEGATASPRSIADVVTLLNALPSPVTLPCFLETLAPAEDPRHAQRNQRPAGGRRAQIEQSFPSNLSFF
jgi:hypothetical protein